MRRKTVCCWSCPLVTKSFNCDANIEAVRYNIKSDLILKLDKTKWLTAGFPRMFKKHFPLFLKLTEIYLHFSKILLIKHLQNCHQRQKTKFEWTNGWIWNFHTLCTFRPNLILLHVLQNWFKNYLILGHSIRIQQISATHTLRFSLFSDMLFSAKI